MPADHDPWPTPVQVAAIVQGRPCSVLRALRKLQAEVGIWRAAARDVVWTLIGKPFGFAFGMPDWESEEDWGSELPDVRHEEFVELGRVFCRIAQVPDLGCAPGTCRLIEDAGSAC